MAAHEGPGKSDEWYTPKYIFDALGTRFDMDVAAPRDLTYVTTPANRFIHEDSLETPWSGFVWMNPPFGKRNGLEPWLGKFFEHGYGIALTPDRTSAPWWQAASKRATGVLFISPKVRFLKPDGTVGDSSPGTGTCLWAAGTLAGVLLRSAAKELGSYYGR